MNKACVLFLIDDSTPMQYGAVDAACSRLACVATAINLTLRQLANGTPVDVGLVGYHHDEQGICVINTCWGRPFEGKRWVSSSELANHPLRVEYRPQPFVDPLTQSVRYENTEFPIWYDAQPAGLPMNRAIMFEVLASMLQDWISKVPRPSAAPLIISFLSDVFPDEPLSSAVKSLARINTPMGIPTLFQFHLAINTNLPPLKYPNDPQFLPPGPLQDLFFACSPLTDSMQNVLRQNQEIVYPMAKGLVFNGRSADLFHFMSLVRHYQGQLPVDLNAASIPMPEVLMDSSIFQALDAVAEVPASKQGGQAPTASRPPYGTTGTAKAPSLYGTATSPKTPPTPPVPPAPPAQARNQASVSPVPPAVPTPPVPPTPPTFSTASTPPTPPAVPASPKPPTPPVPPALPSTGLPQSGSVPTPPVPPTPPTIPQSQAASKTASTPALPIPPESPASATAGLSPAPSLNLRGAGNPTSTVSTPPEKRASAVPELALPPGFERPSMTARDRVMLYPNQPAPTESPRQAAVSGVSVGAGAGTSSLSPTPAVASSAQSASSGMSASPSMTDTTAVSDAEIDLTLNQSMPSIRFSTDVPGGTTPQFEEALPPGLDAASFRGTARWRSWRVSEEETQLPSTPATTAAPEASPNATVPTTVSLNEQDNSRREVPNATVGTGTVSTQSTPNANANSSEFESYNIPPEPGTARWRFWRDFHPNAAPTIPANYAFRCQRLPQVKVTPEPTRLLPRQSLVVLLVDRSVSDLMFEPAQKMWQHRQNKVAFMLGEFARCGRKRYDVALVYYGQNARGETEVVSDMLGRPFVSDEVLAASAGRSESFVVQYPNGVGGLISLPRRRLYFSDVTPTLPANPIPAFQRTAELIREWEAARSQRVLSPLILHITGGTFQQNRYDEALRCLPREDCGGDTPRDKQPPMWLMHWVFTERPHVGVCCPDDEMFTENILLRFLWEHSSMLPGRRLLADVRPGICPQSRGLMVNMDFEVLFEVLDTLAARKTGKMKD